MSLQQWQVVIDVNLTGVFRVAAKPLPRCWNWAPRKASS